MKTLPAAEPVDETGRKPAISGPPPWRVRWYVAFPIAILLIFADAFWIVEAERVGTGPYFTTISLFANVFFLLTGLLIGNGLVRKVAPRAVLSQAELLLIYSMVAVGAALAGQDMLTGLIGMIVYPFQFDNAANGYLGRFGRFLPHPKLLMVSDKDVLAGFYNGHATLYDRAVLHAWVAPVLLWTGFVAMLFWTMQCLNVLVRQGWQERERLPFPVVEIPIQMTEPDGRLWKSGLFWAGFALCAVIEILNGLHSLYPNIPEINDQHVNIQGQGIFAVRPWSAAGFTCYSFYIFAIGLGYLLPLDLLFSCWFFYLFWKGQAILSAVYALDTTPDFPFVREQSFGGYIAILVFMLYNSRNYLSQVWKRVWGEPADVSEAGEALTYRQAFAGLVIGFAALVGFMVWGGMSPFIAIVAFLIYFALSLAITRMRAELGPPVHDLHFSGPDYMLTHEFGTPAFSSKDLTVLSFFYWFNRAYRSHPEPVAIEGLKAAKQIGSSQRTMFWGMALASVVGTVATFWAYLHLAYSLGAQAKFRGGSGFAAEAFNRLNGWLQTPQPPNGVAASMIGVGFVFCALLMFARLKFPWWPFHPIGYAISSSWAMNLLWTPLLIAWIVKGAFLRYGGVGLYRKAMPFFLGLILGQMIVGSLWHLIGWGLGVQPYSFWGG